MYKDSALGIVRHAMTIAGGYLTGAGHLNASEAETMVGAAVALAGVAWSVLHKKQVRDNF
ncbi:MAG: hypothetical protein ACR2RF_32385 [Geminicoccaceae bacterium]